ncbi:MurR/RpiR family transcriptional regulator [Labrys wisconsinensis]|uniref:DNA-binding MurR/RpiR family transcriptional regulator n=1 Tax=Labrys wisconsinensis TaxID=425677 RepID=A0ABU0JMA6_9HYPH|nr:MurR/RpiR family transcriptional regulator [Labrys wisconsinensis]MDQ0474616.1 DNA-binding MurR/RpiR family transcriptional regulator [Labrys wisconsinensis]
MVKPREPDSLLSRVSRMPFSKAERRVVEFLLSIAEYDVASLTSAELAARTRTSRSTIDRLSKRLGFAGIKEMRRALLQESRAMHAPIAGTPRLEPAIIPSDGLGEIALKVFHSASVRALKFAEILSGRPELGQLVAALGEATNVQVFGAGASAVVALDMHQRLLRLGIPINFAEDHHNQIAFASLMAPGDLAIAISYSGRTRSTLQAAEVARRRGARIAAVLGGNGSPLEAIADIRIVTPPGVSLFGTDAVMTRILEMMFNEVLFHCLARQHPALLDNVARIEETLGGERATG